MRARGATWSLSITFSVTADTPARDASAALIERMPLGALVRQLGRLTAAGALRPLSEEADRVCAALADRERVLAAPLHPMALLIALRTYAVGRGERGRLSWEPVGLVSNGFSIADPLDAGLLDVVGFDAAAPALIADFVRG